MQSNWKFLNISANDLLAVVRAFAAFKQINPE